MPTKMKRPCNTPGCNKLITTGSRCEQHQKKKHVDYRKGRTDSEELNFYNSQDWKYISSMLRVRYPVCQECGVNPTAVVHHVKPIKMGGARLSVGNLICLCNSCHGFKHR